jgi:prenyltransferase beta subunit
MLQVARLSPKLLGEAADLTAQFFTSRLNSDGGFQNREGSSDLYYTVFGLEGLCALQRDLPIEAVRRYLKTFGDGDSIDFVHTACLARCYANLGSTNEVPRDAICKTLESRRTPDGGYNQDRGASHGTAYASFLALGAYQDLGSFPPNPEGLLRSLAALRTADGGYANQQGTLQGVTPSTAAVLTLYRQLSHSIPERAAEWLLERCLPEGGFFATPLTPLPDLLSTATALHALSGCGVSLDAIREPCLDYVDSLWSNQGGFYGHWSDDVQDCEYTYYGLLALGHLSL